MSGWQALQGLLAEPAPPTLPEEDDPYLFGQTVQAETVGDVSGWRQLHALLTERAPTRPGVECPNDGTLLQPGRNGRLHCPFDGWQGTPDQAMPAGPALQVSAVDDLYLDLYTHSY